MPNRVRLISNECLRAFTQTFSSASEFFSGNSYTVRSALNAPAFFRPQRLSTEHLRMFTGTFGLHRAPSGAQKLSSFTGHLACPEITRLTFVASRHIGVEF